MNKVLIINEGYSNNLGDQAILDACSKFYEDKGYTTDFLYLSKPHLKALPQYDYKNTLSKKVQKNNLKFRIKAFLSIFYWYLINRKSIIEKLKSNNYAIISIGGGQLINTSGTSMPNNFAIALYWITYLIKKYANTSKVYFVAVGAATKFNSIEKFLYTRSLRKANRIWVRDEFSKKIIKETFDLDTILTHDIAFYVSRGFRVEVSQENIVLVGIANYEEVVVRYIEGKEKTTYFEDIWTNIVGLKKEGYVVKLLYTTVLDVNTLNDFNNFLTQRNEERLPLCNIETLGDLKSELSRASIVYSGRMHALILGLKYGCKVRPYLLSQKLASFNERYVLQNLEIGNISDDIESSLSIMFNNHE
jgi:polysaccharide pyruvyl transferase WcaK-like protein